MISENIWIAFGLTLFAGLATGIGSTIAFFAKRTSTRFLSASLGFSAGVMIYVSLIEIFAQAKTDLVAELGKTKGYWITVAAFFAGIIIMAIIDKLIPAIDNPHELRKLESLDYPGTAPEYVGLYRVGAFAALAVAIHNFPEGLATFTTAVKDIHLGIPIAIAIAIHNIPEGIAISVPIYFATKNRKEAFWISFLSGLAEPIGAVIGYFIIVQIHSNIMSSLIFAAAGGIMVFISIDELMPAAEKYGRHHYAVYGFLAGMAVMAISLLLFV